jgi:predicted RNase H-like HicB family nuclease
LQPGEHIAQVAGLKPGAFSSYAGLKPGAFKLRRVETKRLSSCGIGKYGDTRDAHFSAVGASLTPWIDFKAQEAYNVPLNDGDYDVEKCDLCMCCHVQLHAETRDGASSWTRCALDLYGTYEKVQSLECNWHFRTDDDAANALAVLPWTSW